MGAGRSGCEGIGNRGQGTACKGGGWLFPVPYPCPLNQFPAPPVRVQQRGDGAHDRGARSVHEASCCTAIGGVRPEPGAGAAGAGRETDVAKGYTTACEDATL
jgi:hypothetical protein